MSSYALSSVLAVSMTAAGFGAGLAYFAVLKRTVMIYGVAGASFTATGLTLSRFAGIAMFFFTMSKVSILALLGAFIGFLIARAHALRAIRKTG